MLNTSLAKSHLDDLEIDEIRLSGELLHFFVTEILCFDNEISGLKVYIILCFFLVVSDKKVD